MIKNSRTIIFHFFSHVEWIEWFHEIENSIFTQNQKVWNIIVGLIFEKSIQHFFYSRQSWSPQYDAIIIATQNLPDAIS